MAVAIFAAFEAVREHTLRVMSDLLTVLLCMLWILGKALFDFSRALKGLPPGRNNRRFLLHGGIAIILASLAEGFFEYNLGDSEVLTMFLVVLAASYLAVEKDVIEG